VDQAWRRGQIVTLVAFDLKGAFNGVSKNSLDTQLQTKRILAMARKWIRSFMEDRQASITFDDFESAVGPLRNAGLA
jgi:hypothetical protein